MSYHRRMARCAARYRHIAQQAAQQPALCTAGGTGLTGRTRRSLLLAGLRVAEQWGRHEQRGRVRRRQNAAELVRRAARP